MEIAISGIDIAGSSTIPTGFSGSSNPTGYAQVYVRYANPTARTDGTFDLHESPDENALRGGVTQATVALFEEGVADVIWRSINGSVTVLNGGVDGYASASLLRHSISRVRALPSAAANLKWSCAPTPLRAVDPCTLMTAHEASAVTGEAMGPAARFPGLAALFPGQAVTGGGPWRALAGPLHFCEFSGANVNVAVEAYQGGDPATARTYFDGLVSAHFGERVRQLAGLDTAAAIGSVPLSEAGEAIDAIYILHGSVVLDVACFPKSCADNALRAAAIFATQRLP